LNQRQIFSSPRPCSPCLRSGSLLGIRYDSDSLGSTQETDLESKACPGKEIGQFGSDRGANGNGAAESDIGSWVPNEEQCGLLISEGKDTVQKGLRPLHDQLGIDSNPELGLYIKGGSSFTCSSSLWFSNLFSLTPIAYSLSKL
jgi:hypothetical protein